MEKFVWTRQIRNGCWNFQFTLAFDSHNFAKFSLPIMHCSTKFVQESKSFRDCHNAVLFLQFSDTIFLQYARFFVCYSQKNALFLVTSF